ncbi:MAG TPA: hypothetical protein VFE14_07105 [Micromonosporaceae bacterium]|jgi:hypothetical protein|nr:hypothetical protein [Micromonosporaceae bacterium]
MAAPDDQHAAVTREILVRYLDAWTPAALHGARRVTYASTGGQDESVAALRVFGEFADRLAGHRLAMVLAAPSSDEATALAERLDTVHSELGGPAELTVEVSAGSLQPVADGAVFVYLAGTGAPLHPDAVVELAAGRATEILLTVSAALAERYRTALRGAGLAATVQVELVDRAGAARLLLFATAVPKHLEKFKDELWSVDEFAGVRYRDPLDPGHTLVDISLAPDVGPLRRSLLRHLAEAGPQAVAELRRWTLDETIYRLADLNRLLTPLVSTGAVGRDPAKGRLTPETIIVPR